MSETIGVLETLGFWVEAFALIAIFFLDLKERKENRKERREQHEENAAQLQVAQSQAEATKKSADAATEAASAAKKSAEISASLNRPFMGLSNVALPGGAGTRLWNIVFALKNYGTLPALNVGLAVSFFTDNTPRATKTESASVQIFPADEFSSIVQFDLGDVDLAPVQNGKMKLRMDVRIPYRSDDNRKFEFLAQVSYVYGRFEIDRSETR